MRIVESCMVGKKSQKECEDGLVVTDDFIAVIDGSTSKTLRHISPDMKNGRYSMALISNFIRHKLTVDATAADFCHGITEYFQSEVYAPLLLMERLSSHPEERLAASVVVYSNNRKEVWMIGDCQTVVNGCLYENSKPYEQEIAQRRVELITHGVSPVNARKYIEPLLIKAMQEGQNKSYAVIDGFPVFMDGVKVIALDSCGAEIVLASDGYPFLKSTLEDSEAVLAQLLKNDPQCVRDFIATKGLVRGNKSFDDRTYIRFVV